MRIQDLEVLDVVRIKLRIPSDQIAVGVVHRKFISGGKYGVRVIGSSTDGSFDTSTQTDGDILELIWSAGEAAKLETQG